MSKYQYKNSRPTIAPDAFVFDEAVIIGDVHLESGVGVWPGVVIRADNDRITVGKNSNVQEGAVLHVDPGVPMEIGQHVTIGHQAMLHGCTVGEGALIGIGAVVLNNARIGRESLIGAGALVPEGREIPPRSLVIGVGKILRTLTDEEIDEIRRGTDSYVKKARDLHVDLTKITDN